MALVLTRAIYSFEKAPRRLGWVCVVLRASSKGSHKDVGSLIGGFNSYFRFWLFCGNQPTRGSAQKKSDPFRVAGERERERERE